MPSAPCHTLCASQILLPDGAKDVEIGTPAVVLVEDKVGGRMQAGGVATASQAARRIQAHRRVPMQALPIQGVD
jgi:hypothetical protein